MLNITVLGGTKFIGAALVKKLVSAGHNVTVISRVKELPASLQGKIQHISEDLSFAEGETSKNRASRIAKLFSGRDIDIIIDNISMRSPDIESNINALMFSSQKIKQYILCSSIAVLNNWNVSEPVKETQVNLNDKDYEPHIFSPTFSAYYPVYAKGKRSVEREIMALSLMHDFAYTIMRPAVIEGPNDHTKRTWYWIQRLLDSGEILIPNTRTMYRHVYIEDVATAFFNAAGNLNAFNQTFNIAGEEILTVEEYLHNIADLLNIPKTEVKLVPAKHEEIVAAVPSFEFPGFFSGTALIANIDKAKTNLNYQPTPFKSWMGSTIQWILKERENLPNSLGYENRAKEINYAKALLTRA